MMRVQNLRSLVLVFAAAGLAGCPGGSPTPVTTVSPACANCGAVGPTLYGGKGVGVWAYTNDTDRPVTIPVNIGMLPGNDVTLVFSNDGSQAQPMPAIPIQAQPSSAKSALQSPPVAMDGSSAQSMADRIREFNQRGWVERLARIRSGKGAPPMAANGEAVVRLPSVIDSKVGDKRQWYNDEKEPMRDTTLVRQSTMRDGVVLNVWIEDSEYGDDRVTDAVVNTLAESYGKPNGIYDFMVDIGGPMWGAHNDPELIGPDRQPVNLVILRINEENAMGYFTSSNAFVNAPGTETANSNEAVALFVNAAALYPDKPNGPPLMLLTLSHESVHMQNFYRRGVTLGVDYIFADWLEEGSAIMMADYASQRLLTGYNDIRDNRLPDYLSTPSYGCSVTVWPKSGDACDGYAVWGAWGGFLNRQLGMPFYRNLLNDKTHKKSEQVLDAAIRSVRPDSGMVPELRRWAASVGALIPAKAAPARYGYPARADTGFPLPEIDLQTQVATRKLPATLAPTLAGHAMAPVVRRNVKGTYSESVTVPPRSTLSVVIHDGKV